MTTERRREWWKRYYADHAEEYRERSRAWHRANKTAANRRRVLRDKRDLVASRKRKRIWAAAHREQQYEWQRAHPEERAHREAKRRARIFGNGGSHTLADWREKVEMLGGVCVYCGERKPLVRDHAVPLVRGGSHNIENILPACRSCNSRKYSRTVGEFMAVLEAA